MHFKDISDHYKYCIVPFRFTSRPFSLLFGRKRKKGFINRLHLIEFLCHSNLMYKKLSFFFLPDAKLCKERREPSRWLYVSGGLEGTCAVLRELAGRGGCTSSCSLCLDSRRRPAKGDFEAI